MIDLKTSLALVSVVPIKIITTLLLSILRAISTTCKWFVQSTSPNNSSGLFIIMFHLVVVLLFLLHRVNSRHGVVQAPLLSFPSLSRPLVSLASISLTQPLASFRSIPRPLASLPSLSLQAILGNLPFKKDPVVPVLETVVPSAPPEPEGISYDSVDAADEEGMSMEDTWKAILASSRAKPVKLNHGDIQESALETVVREARERSFADAMERRKKKEKRAKRTEQRSEGLRQRDALVTPHDDLSQQADAFIKKQKDYLKLQKEESDRQRQLRLEWRRTNDHQNPF